MLATNMFKTQISLNLKNLKISRMIYSVQNVSKKTVIPGKQKKGKGREELIPK